jgi:hypothetical protein
MDATEKLLVLRLIAASAAGVLLSMRKVSVILQVLPRTRAASAFWLAGVLLLGLHAVQRGWWQSMDFRQSSCSQYKGKY